eukprot:Hpha_TRINITY_DN15955_c1_g1::TRINITY_DN15955_c1_g1_i1::g.70774::m.70774/K17616/CTDSPL2; CTD small phosphatase-like protein 2
MGNCSSQPQPKTQPKPKAQAQTQALQQCDSTRCDSTRSSFDAEFGTSSMGYERSFGTVSVKSMVLSPEGSWAPSQFSNLLRSMGPCHNETPGEPLLPPVVSHGFFATRSVNYTLVLDIDECLIRVDKGPKGQASNTMHKRPHLAKFMAELVPLKAKGLEVVLWTSSTKLQAQAACRLIDKNHNVVDHLIWRSSKWVTKDPDGVLFDQATGISMRCFKDLSLLGRETDRCILIDNAHQNCYEDQPRSIVIDAFNCPREQRGDQALLGLGEMVRLMMESSLEVPSFLERSSVQGFLRNVKVTVPGLEPMRLRLMRVDRLMMGLECRRAAEKQLREAEFSISDREESLSFVSIHEVSSIGTSEPELTPGGTNKRDSADSACIRSQLAGFYAEGETN